jgi:sulfite oxidase
MSRRVRARKLEATAIGWTLITPHEYKDEEAYVASTRSRTLKVNGEQPFNAEPDLEVLVGPIQKPALVTPVENYYVRNHGPVPLPRSTDQSTFQFQIDMGPVSHTRTVGQLYGEFPATTSECTLMCAGNRRNELSEICPIDGVPWDSGAIGNSVWGGISLRRVLTALLPRDLGPDVHVEFEGADFSPEEAENGRPHLGFLSSMSLLTVLSDLEDRILLCTEQNGIPLTPDHGWPLRLIVPGVIGARSVKWLKRISLRRGPSDGFFVLQDYKIYPPKLLKPTAADWLSLPPVFDYPVTAVISHVQKGESYATVTGYAAAGGGRSIIRVQVNGVEAKISEPNRFTWALWQANLPGPVKGTVCCVATDDAGNRTPDKSTWNVGGILANGIDCKNV